MVLGQNGGILRKAEEVTEQYLEAKARETLEIALSALQIEKYEQSLTLENLDNRITEEINKIGGEEIGNNKNEVIIDGYIFQVDRTIPKIVDELRKADGVIISASVNGNKEWFKEGETISITVTGVIKTYSGGNITSVSATKDGAPILDFSINEKGEYTITNITSNTEIIINAEDSNKKSNSKKIPITIKKDNIVPILLEVTATVEARKIKIKATAVDNESGLKQISYSVEPTTITDGKATGTLMSEQEIILTATTNENYTIKFTAEDNAGNKSVEQTKTVETLGAIKHINTQTGLKEVNTVDIYGATINGYECARKDIEWQLFYIDETKKEQGNVIESQVYLISKNYMSPPTAETEMTCASKNNSYPQSCRWNDTVLNKYKKALPEKNTTSNLGLFMGKFLSDYEGIDASSQENLQATNYMLDQTIWSEYKGAKADLALGGPTLPLFQASYNDICRSKTKLGINKGEKGYQIKRGDDNWTTMIRRLWR